VVEVVEVLQQMAQDIRAVMEFCFLTGPLQQILDLLDTMLGVAVDPVKPVSQLEELVVLAVVAGALEDLEETKI
jgi:hypothetical protein